MNRKYSVFISNVASCNDRYCSGYDREFTMDEMFDRVKSIPLISSVDLVMNHQFLSCKQQIKENLKRTGLNVASVAVDTFANPLFKQGSLSSLDAKIRSAAIDASKDAMDFAAELGCKVVTLWPGQDGYDYIFQADYMKERRLFSDAVEEICNYRKDIQVTLEYKAKEPRTHCYINTVGSTLLMIEDIGAENLGVALDYGHAALGYENPAESVAMCKMYGDRLKHIHINDNYRLWDDDMIVGSVHSLEYLEFVYWLRKTGYDGYITMDQFPYREDGRDAVCESTMWLDSLEKIIDRADIGEIEKVISQKDAIASSRLMRKLLIGE
ncbi:MAG: sugar phosphate isomerase/epimerase [Clostridia bacterium]|nr:sugar phosphate isomerase/epimerase [Clostridia bacterium]